MPDTPSKLETRRDLALRLAAISAGFCVAVAAVLVVFTATEGRDRWLESAELKALTDRLTAAPTSEPLRAQIRALDQQLRHAYLTHRERRRLGAWFLLVGAVLFLGSRHWAQACTPDSLPAVPPGPDAEAARQRSDRERAVRVTLGVAGGLAALLLLAAVGMRGERPPPPATATGAPTPPAAPPPAYGTPEWQRNWPRFRGPAGTGVATGDGWPTTWDAAQGKGIAWKVPLPEPASPSSPIVWGDRLFLTVADKDNQRLLAYACRDGTQLWTADVRVPRCNPTAFAEMNVMADTGYAAATPATDGRLVFVTYATADIAAFDFDGKPVWGRNLGLPESSYGLASSLAPTRDALVWQLDQGFDPDAKKSALLALDPRSGRELWRTVRAVTNTWSSPIVIPGPGGDQIVTTSNPWLIAYAAQDGRERWRAEAVGGEIAPSAVFADGIVYTANAGAQAAAVRADGSGDVTKTHVLWTSMEGLPDTASPIADGRYLLEVGSDGVVTCLDAKTGQTAWQQTFEDRGFIASPVLAGGLVYLFDDKGVTYVVRLGPKYEQVSTGTIGEALRASPALAEGAIYFRGEKHLFCIRTTASAPAVPSAPPAAPAPGPTAPANPQPPAAPAPQDR